MNRNSAGIISAPPRVAIIILNWNNYKYTSVCLRTIENLEYPNYQVILVDNGSTDGSGERLEYEFSKYIFIRNKINLGFAGGNNIAIKYAITNKYDYVLLLNNDTRVINPRFLNEMVNYAETNSKTGVVGPKIFKSESELQKSILRFPTLSSAVHYRLVKSRKNNYNEINEVESLSGCCVLVRRSVIEDVGLLDENLFLYAEETEWFYRIRKHGWKVIFLPVESILHYGAQTTSLIQSKDIYVMKRSNFVYILAKHGFKVQAFLFGLRCILSHLFKLPFLRLRKIKCEKVYDLSLIKLLTKDIIKKWKMGLCAK